MHMHMHMQTSPLQLVYKVEVELNTYIDVDKSSCWEGLCVLLGVRGWGGGQQSWSVFCSCNMVGMEGCGLVELQSCSKFFLLSC